MMVNESVVVKGTVTSKQAEALDKLVGVLGSNRQDVVGKILTIWMYNEGLVKAGKKDAQKR